MSHHGMSSAILGFILHQKSSTFHFDKPRQIHPFKHEHTHRPLAFHASSYWCSSENNMASLMRGLPHTRAIWNCSDTLQSPRRAIPNAACPKQTLFDTKLKPRFIKQKPKVKYRTSALVRSERRERLDVDRTKLQARTVKRALEKQRKERLEILTKTSRSIYSALNIFCASISTQRMKANFPAQMHFIENQNKCFS